jgi:ATP diphosphatase
MELLDRVVALEEEAFEFGFRWENTKQIMNQIRNECDEVEEYLDQSSRDNQALLQEEIGDLLHAVFSLCLFHRMSPKVTLGQALTKFERRLRAVQLIAEEEGLSSLEDQPFNVLMTIWDKAKLLVG